MCEINKDYIEAKIGKLDRLITILVNTIEEELEFFALLYVVEEESNQLRKDYQVYLQNLFANKII